MKKQIINSFSFVKGETMPNFGGIKTIFDSENNEIPSEISESARKVLDAYSNDESISMYFDTENKSVRIKGKCTGGVIKLV